jgi:hypothetical protein
MSNMNKFTVYLYRKGVEQEDAPLVFKPNTWQVDSGWLILSWKNEDNADAEYDRVEAYNLDGFGYFAVYPTQHSE